MSVSTAYQHLYILISLIHHQDRTLLHPTLTAVLAGRPPPKFLSLPDLPVAMPGSVDHTSFGFILYNINVGCLLSYYH